MYIDFYYSIVVHIEAIVCYLLSLVIELLELYEK